MIISKTATKLQKAVAEGWGCDRQDMSEAVEYAEGYAAVGYV